jgi:hypothetical protein
MAHYNFMPDTLITSDAGRRNRSSSRIPHSRIFTRGATKKTGVTKKIPPAAIERRARPRAVGPEDRI